MKTTERFPLPSEAALLTAGLEGVVSSEVRKWLRDCLPTIGKAFDPAKNGHLPDWWAALDAVAPGGGDGAVLDAPAVADGGGSVDPAALRIFHPWRKGPYRLGGVEIDSEWRSDLKWARLKPALEPLAGRHCLDVGCGNGYHCWRMRGEGAASAIGLDPFLLYVMQFLVVWKRIPDPAVRVLPLGAEAIRPDLGFDSVFSMGVLSHCREHQTHLMLLKQALRPGGQLVLETLSVPDAFGPLLIPKGRYAQMRNIHALPDVSTLAGWLKEAGFGKIRHVDTSVTPLREQRRTAWMTFHSLENYLDPENSALTVEGHPAPQRSIFTAER